MCIRDSFYRTLVFARLVFAVWTTRTLFVYRTAYFLLESPRVLAPPPRGVRENFRRLTFLFVSRSPQFSVPEKNIQTSSSLVPLFLPPPPFTGAQTRCLTSWPRIPGSRPPFTSACGECTVYDTDISNGPLPRYAFPVPGCSRFFTLFFHQSVDLI